MPFFKVKTVSKIEKEVIVEAENMSFAMTKAFNAIRTASHENPIPYSSLYFDEAHAQLLEDPMAIKDALLLIGDTPVIR